ncbi:MAG TPA: hypothetical protein VGN37_14870 [Actinocatenispora sp.]
MLVVIGWALSLVVAWTVGAVWATGRRTPRPLPEPGDVVRIRGGSVDRFRVIHADHIPGRTGWVCLRGWDIDVDPIRYTALDVRGTDVEVTT